MEPQTNILQKPALPAGTSSFGSKLRQIWQQLDAAQRCYLLASVLGLGWLISEQPWLAVLLGLSLGGAVSVEIWQGFVRIWHSLAGKAVILLCYAILANFCLALADNMVNDLIGVRPDVAPLSVNMTLMLLAPFWSFLLAFVLLTLYLMLHSLKIGLLLLLRPVGVRSHHLLSGSYPLWTGLARLVFIPVICMYLALVVQSYLTGSTDSWQLTNTAPASTQLTATAKGAQPLPVGATPEQNRPEQADSPLQINLDDGTLVDNLTPQVPWVYRSVAWFFYHIESLNKSQCPLAPGEHMVHLNDYEILVIAPDQAAPFGYRYQVRACGSPSLPVFTPPVNNR